MNNWRLNGCYSDTSLFITSTAIEKHGVNVLTRESTKCFFAEHKLTPFCCFNKANQGKIIVFFWGGGKNGNNVKKLKILERSVLFAKYSAT